MSYSRKITLAKGDSKFLLKCKDGNIYFDEDKIVVVQQLDNYT